MMQKKANYNAATYVATANPVQRNVNPSVTYTANRAGEPQGL